MKLSQWLKSFLRPTLYVSEADKLLSNIRKQAPCDTPTQKSRRFYLQSIFKRRDHILK